MSETAYRCYWVRGYCIDHNVVTDFWKYDCNGVGHSKCNTRLLTEEENHIAKRRGIPRPLWGQKRVDGKLVWKEGL